MSNGREKMMFPEAIDEFVMQGRAAGRFSPRTQDAYRRALDVHRTVCEGNGHMLVREADKLDVLMTLERWTTRATKRNRYAILNSFYRWTVNEDLRSRNPVRSIDAPPRPRPNPIPMQDLEVWKFLEAGREMGGPHWWLAELLIASGLRNAELRGLQARDLASPGVVEVRGAVAKGGRPRWVPVPDSLAAVAADVLRQRQPREFVFASRQTRDVGVSEPRMHEDPSRPMSPQAMMRMVDQIAKRAGLGVRVTPHRFRHKFGRLICEEHGAWLAKEALGHADIGTTVEHYVGRPTSEQLAQIVSAVAKRMQPPPAAA